MEEEIGEEELEDGTQSVGSLSSTLTSAETLDAIDLWKQQKKELEKPLHLVREEIEVGHTLQEQEADDSGDAQPNLAINHVREEGRVRG